MPYNDLKHVKTHLAVPVLVHLPAKEFDKFASPQKSMLSAILHQWPGFGDPDGFRLTVSPPLPPDVPEIVSAALSGFGTLHEERPDVNVLSASTAGCAVPRLLAFCGRELERSKSKALTEWEQQVDWLMRTQPFLNYRARLTQLDAPRREHRQPRLDEHLEERPAYQRNLAFAEQGIDRIRLLPRMSMPMADVIGTDVDLAAARSARESWFQLGRDRPEAGGGCAVLLSSPTPFAGSCPVRLQHRELRADLSRSETEFADELHDALQDLAADCQGQRPHLRLASPSLNLSTFLTEGIQRRLRGQDRIRSIDFSFSGKSWIPVLAFFSLIDAAVNRRRAAVYVSLTDFPRIHLTMIAAGSKHG